MSFGGGAANAKLPDGFAPYPGATMTGGFTATGKGSRSGMASFEAPGKAEAVIAHFRRQAEAAGFKVNAEMKTGDTLMIAAGKPGDDRSEEHTSELQSLMRNSYAVFCLKKKKHA